MRHDDRPTDAPRPVRAAVVGAGRISERHLAFLRSSPLAEIVGICDANPYLASYMGDRYGGTAFVDLRTMLDQTGPELLHVLTPPDLHAEMATTALDAGAHVVVEKPMALDGDDREALLRRAAETGRLLVEDHNYRFNRPMLSLVSAVSAGAIGRPTDLDVSIAIPLVDTRHADANVPSPSHRLPAGFMHEYITHLAYLAIAVVPDIEVVEARWMKRVHDHASPYDELQALASAEGLVGRLRITSIAPGSAISVTITGTEGRAAAELIFGSYRLDRRRRVGAQLSPAANAVIGGTRSALRGLTYLVDRLRGRDAYEGIHELLRRSYRAVLTGSPPPVTPGDMRRTGNLVDDLVGTMP